MKKFILLIMLLTTGAVIYDGLFQPVNSSPTGAAAGYANDPQYNFANCGNCHPGPTSIADTGLITSTIPATGYLPDSTYTITATVTRMGHVRFGFEISPQDTLGNYLGLLINTNANTQLTAGNSHYITHTFAGTTGTNDYHTWTFDWTAPYAGTGDVTFYGSFNATNNNFTQLGDTCIVSKMLVHEGSITTGIRQNEMDQLALKDLYPNPANGDNAMIEYHLPQGVNAAEIVLYSIDGIELKSYPVVANIHTLALSTNELNNGIYLYQLRTASTATALKKIVVVK